MSDHSLTVKGFYEVYFLFGQLPQLLVNVPIAKAIPTRVPIAPPAPVHAAIHTGNKLAVGIAILSAIAVPKLPPITVPLNVDRVAFVERLSMPALTR